MPVARLVPGLLLLCATVPAMAQSPMPQADPGREASLTRPDQMLADTARAPRDVLAAVMAWKAPQPATDLAAVRSVLGAGDAIVEFVQWRRSEETRTTAFVLRREGEPVRCELGATGELQRALSTWLRLLARERHPLDEASQHLLDESARRVAGLVLNPLTPALHGCQRVYFAPDGDLWILPFDALPATRSGTLLLETLDVRRLACGSELASAAARAEAHAPGTLLVVDGGSIDHPEAGREARAVAAAWQSAQRGPALLRTPGELAATDPAHLSNAFVHLAGTHQLMPPGPARAATAREATWPTSATPGPPLLGCRLLVTTVPATADPGDTLAAASFRDRCASLRSLGAASCLLPSWPVDAAFARDLTTSCWREVGRDGEPARALRRLKLARLEANRAACGRALPGTWAAFQLVGDGGP